MAPLFVPRTQEGRLITKLREVQESLNKLGTRAMPKIKLVEEGGVMIKSLLVRSDPWKDIACTDTQCSTCQPGEDAKPGKCRVRSVVY